MTKLELLIKRYPGQVEELVNELYKKNFKKEKKKIYHFKALGKSYDSNIFTENYIGFLKDVSKIHSYEFFKLCIPPCLISQKKDSFTDSHLEGNRVVKICDALYVSTNTSTEKKIEHIKNICELLGVNIVELVS